MLRVDSVSGRFCSQIFFTPSMITSSTLSDTGIKKVTIFGDDKIASVAGAKENSNDIRLKITFSESATGLIEFLRTANNSHTISYPDN